MTFQRLFVIARRKMPKTKKTGMRSSWIISHSLSRYCITFTVRLFIGLDYWLMLYFNWLTLCTYLYSWFIYLRFTIKKLWTTKFPWWMISSKNEYIQSEKRSHNVIGFGTRFQMTHKNYLKLFLSLNESDCIKKKFYFKEIPGFLQRF